MVVSAAAIRRLCMWAAQLPRLLVGEVFEVRRRADVVAEGLG